MDQFSTTFFNAGMFGPSPKTKKPFRTLPKGVKYSENPENFYETLEGDAIKPKIHHVFDRLHELCEWMKIPEIKKANYTIWKNQLILAHNGDGRLIHEALRKVIIDYHLNPSERVKFDDNDYCIAGRDGGCVWDTSFNKCRKPNIDDYALLKLQTMGINILLVPIGQLKLFVESLKPEFARIKSTGADEYKQLCKMMRFMGASKKTPDYEDAANQQFNMKPMQNNAALDDVIRKLQNGVPFFTAIQNKPMQKPVYTFMRT
jgi:hypothetical protein